MGFRRGKYNNDAIVLLKYALISLLIILLPITLFLTAFAWYGSLVVNVTNNPDIADSMLFLKNSLIFGTIGLLSSLLYFILFLIVRFGLNRVLYRIKKYILFSAILVATLLFLLFEIFSIIFIDYFYSWQLSLVLIFWPLLYVVLCVLLLINYFSYYNEQKELILSKKRQSEQEKELYFRDRTETMF